MHHSLKIKILDLDHIESIVEQDITDVEAEKIVGGLIGSSEKTIHIPLLTAWLFVQPLDSLNEQDKLVTNSLLATPVVPMILDENTQM
ncbi:hypothetical protein [Nostoc sp. FACHB-888]|uniref:hypothetical protein n=1 Tax=Nostoc sp. FACHB-888 TaxID=2692842 RepID=UPI00168771C5|nr:hypothetical protein [Nostoc sp. FACHB-888]MBD2244995.1 hypothetical protein [Nostoc sp. FACHB-888]MCC5652408.1 hypothetical protein [Nostoc sp. XA013]